MIIRFKWWPKQKKFRKAVNHFPVVFYGGSKGCGKSHGLRNIMLERALTYSKSTGAIFRMSYPELEANHIRPLLADYPGLRAYWGEAKKILSLPNGSTLQFCHCRNDADISLYQGREIHNIGIEEVGTWPESMFHTLRGSNRSSNPNIPARTLMTGNPGGAGHQWLKRLFIDRKFNKRERAEDYYFVPATIQDNPSLIDNDPDYLARLEAEPNEMLRKAFLYGSWDLKAGQYFSEFDREVHVIDGFEIPQHWTRFGSYDYGHTHPAAWYKYAVDGDGNLYVYWELCRAQMGIDEQANLLKEPTTWGGDDWKKANPYWSGHDVFAKGKAGDPSIAEDFALHQIYLKRANINRKLGAARIRSFLHHEETEYGRKGPKVFIFKCCPILIDCLPRMIHDIKDVEDVLKVDADDGDPWTGDDSYDSFRYGIMSRPAPTQPLEQKWRDTYRGEYSEPKSNAWTV